MFSLRCRRRNIDRRIIFCVATLASFMTLLYLDFDAPIDPDEIEKAVFNLANMVQMNLELRAIHPTKRGHHVIVNAEWKALPSAGERTRLAHAVIPLKALYELSPVETVAMQLLLGSDPKREAFNLLRAHNLGDAPAFWRDRWNVLYAEKLTE